MRKKYFNRALTTITALTLVSGMFPASALTASAENSGNYLDRVWDADNRQIIETLTSMPEMLYDMRVRPNCKTENGTLLKGQILIQAVCISTAVSV